MIVNYNSLSRRERRKNARQAKKKNAIPAWVIEARENGGWSRHQAALADRIARTGMEGMNPDKPILLSPDKFIDLVTVNGKLDWNKWTSCLDCYGDINREVTVKMPPDEQARLLESLFSGRTIEHKPDGGFVLRK
jgi:hypothetical protein